MRPKRIDANTLTKVQLRKIVGLGPQARISFTQIATPTPRDKVPPFYTMVACSKGVFQIFWKDGKFYARMKNKPPRGKRWLVKS